MPEIVVNEKDVEWDKSTVTPGVAGKMLAFDKETKAHAMLVRYDPGVVVPSSSCPCLEQVYVLEGEREYDGKVYGPGTHHIRPAGYEHGPVKAGEKGCVVLCVFSGLSGIEETEPEFKEYLKSIGAL